MIDLYTLTPDRLNLNGDQANLLIMQKLLVWLGEESRVIALGSEEELRRLSEASWSPENPSMFLIGHGSFAAMKSISLWKVAVQNFVDHMKKLGIPGIVVGSSCDWLQEHSPTERRSEFVRELVGYPQDASELEFFGYLNSDTDTRVVSVQESVIFTKLHGPMLLKSPQVAAKLIEMLCGKSVEQIERWGYLEGLVAEAIAVANGERN